jgi:hypothetical protein
LYPLHITVAYVKPPETAIRRWREGMKEAHRVEATEWHERMLPKHFRKGAAARYGHQKRKPEYLKFKRMAAAGKGPYRKRGPVLLDGQVDNVFSGLLMHTLLGFASIRPYPTRVTVRMSGPRYITMRPYLSGQPDKAREVTAVAADEQQQLDATLRREVLARFNNAAETPLVFQIPG